MAGFSARVRRHVYTSLQHPGFISVRHVVSDGIPGQGFLLGVGRCAA